MAMGSIVKKNDITDHGLQTAGLYTSEDDNGKTGKNSDHPHSK